MSTPIITDVFKFVAVRPVQRLQSDQTANYFIRDARAATAGGVRKLQLLARQLTDPAQAVEAYKGLDLAPLELLAGQYQALVHLYQSLSNNDPQPAKDMLSATRIDAGRAEYGDAALALAWDALYAAHATGNTAGALLDTPMSALRLLHYLKLITGKFAPTKVEALRILTATVVVPAELHNLLIRESPNRGGQSATMVSRSSGDASESAPSPQVSALANALTVTHRLTRLLGSAQASTAQAPVSSIQPTSASSGFLTVSTVPKVQDVVKRPLTSDEMSVLDQLSIAGNSDVPAAITALQNHLQSLSEAALPLATQTEFVDALKIAAGGMIGPSRSAAPTIASDVDVSGRITPLGIGDLKVVKQTLLSYVAGEVAYIENVLQGESKERTHRNLDRTETTLFNSEEDVSDKERDTQSTDRFELKREAETTIKEDMSVKAGLTVTATYGPIVATATGDFAYATSKQNSEKTSSNFAHEVVDKAVSKVQTTVKTERTTKTLSEVEEINKHGFDNSAAGGANITGIYRWVDKRYRAQVYNYGVRLLLEFIIPEPAAFYRATHSGAVRVNAQPPPPFLTEPSFNVATGAVGLGLVPPRPLTPEDLNETNYQRYAARYGASGVAAPPPLYTYIGISMAPTQGLGKGQALSIASKDFVVPLDYVLNSYSATASMIWINFPQFNLQVRGDIWELLNSNGGGGEQIVKRQIGDIAGNNARVAGPVPVSITCYDIISFSLNLQGVCVRTADAMTKWQIATFKELLSAYQALQTAYDQKVAQAESAAGLSIAGQNPAANRSVEKIELKKQCITMMTGQHYAQFGAMLGQDTAANPAEIDVLAALAQGGIMQFFEQAFEWEQITYLFYPYYWGRKPKWLDVVNLLDPDPLFQQFLTAGAVRVQVPVPVAYADDVLYLLQNPFHETDLAKKVWGGGDRPFVGSLLYESIADEIRNQTDDLAGAIAEGTPWEFTLPTTLVWLQPDGTLPVLNT